MPSPYQVAPTSVAWLERADIFAHTSRWEGFGIVLLEAMLAGLPVVATRVSAVPEVVADGGAGLLVEAGDVRALAGALETLLADRERASALGEAGRQRALEEFSVAPNGRAHPRRLRKGTRRLVTGDRSDHVKVRCQ